MPNLTKIKQPAETVPAPPPAGFSPLLGKNTQRAWVRISALARKELYSYFYSPIAYVVMVIYLLFAGWFFFSRFFLFGQIEMRMYFGTAPLLLMFLAPAITMRLLAEEINTGSYEMLMTLPLTITQMLLGKFLAAFAFLAVIIGVTLSYPLTIASLGPLDWGPVMGGYLGLLVLGAAFLSIGLFTSALTRNQIVAFILGFALCFVLFLVDKILMLIPGFLVGFFEYLGVEYHTQNFSRGVVDSKDLIYFASIIIIAFIGTRLVLERRK
ncbi:ABC transporter permease subunit [candidate division FCPU426 bacterium]|nr:ABC transporter permease subunit [candidate division FCPU426 bacterium]